MKTILYLATTPNGFIARADDSTRWSAQEWQAFHNECARTGNLVVGRRTFEVMQEDDEFSQLPDMEIVVVSKSDPDVVSNARFVTSPSAALKAVSDLGLEHALVGGGRELAIAFLRERLVDFLVLDVEPVLFSDGIGPLGDFGTELKLDLLQAGPRSDGGVQLRYQVAYQG